MTEILSEVTWIAAAASAVSLARNADEARRQADLLTDAATALEKLRLIFKQLQQSATVVRTLGWDGVALSPELLRDLAQAEKTLDSRPLTKVQGELDRFGRDVSASLKEHWSIHAADRLGDLADLLSLAKTLSEVDGMSDVSQQLLTTIGELARSRGSLPTAESVQLLTRAETLLEQLEASLQPEEVRLFLSAVAHGGAPLESLTPDVANWLADHQSLGRFRVVATSPVED